MMVDWKRIEDLVRKLSEESGLSHVRVYGDMLKLEEVKFDDYLMRMNGDVRFGAVHFYYSSISDLRKIYRDERKALNDYLSEEKL